MRWRPANPKFQAPVSVPYPVLLLSIEKPCSQVRWRRGIAVLPLHVRAALSAVWVLRLVMPSGR